MSCYCWLERLLHLGFLVGVNNFQFSPPFEMMNFYGFLSLCFLVLLLLCYFCLSEILVCIIFSHLEFLYFSFLIIIKQNRETDGGYPSI